MTTFQLAATGLFVATLVAAKRQELANQVKTLLSKLWPTVAPAPGPNTGNHAAELVDDLVTVAALRDRLAVLGCTDGEEACTVLLRILVEYRPNKG